MAMITRAFLEKQFKNFAAKISEVFSRKKDAAHSLDVTMDSETYKITIKLLNESEEVLSTKTVDLPLETTVVSGKYDQASKTLVLTLENGSELKIGVGDLVSGYLPLAGGKMTGNLELKGGGIIEASDSTYMAYIENVLDANSYYTGMRLQINIGSTDTANPVPIFYTKRKSQTEWERQYIYTTAHKPTAQDVGALPTTGGTLTGDLTLSGDARIIKFASESRNGSPIKFYKGDFNGSNIVIGDGGRTIIGGGESADNLHNALETVASDESMHIAGDGSVKVHTNCQTIAQRKTFTFSANGNLAVPRGGMFKGKSTKAEHSVEVSLSGNTIDFRTWAETPANVLHNFGDTYGGETTIVRYYWNGATSGSYSDMHLPCIDSHIVIHAIPDTDSSGKLTFLWCTAYDIRSRAIYTCMKSNQTNGWTDWTALTGEDGVVATAGTAEYFNSNYLTVGTDLNTIKTPGFYYGTGGDYTNHPSSISQTYFGLIVTNSSARYYSQFYLVNDEIFYRFYSDNQSIWSTWKRLYTEADPPSLEDITSLPLPVSKGGTGKSTNSAAAIVAIDNVENDYAAIGIVMDGARYHKEMRLLLPQNVDAEYPKLKYYTKRRSTNVWSSQNIYTNHNKPTPAEIGALGADEIATAAVEAQHLGYHVLYKKDFRTYMEDFTSSINTASFCVTDVNSGPSDNPETYHFPTPSCSIFSTIIPLSESPSSVCTSHHIAVANVRGSRGVWVCDYSDSAGWTDWVEVLDTTGKSGAKIYYGVCDTLGLVGNKQVTIPGGFTNASLADGTLFAVRFTKGNSSTSTFSLTMGDATTHDASYGDEAAGSYIYGTDLSVTGNYYLFMYDASAQKYRLLGPQTLYSRPSGSNLEPGIQYDMVSFNKSYLYSVGNLYILYLDFTIAKELANNQQYEILSIQNSAGIHNNYFDGRIYAATKNGKTLEFYMTSVSINIIGKSDVTIGDRVCVQYCFLNS